MSGVTGRSVDDRLPDRGTEIELAIEKLVAGGDGLGRLAGVPVFVAKSAPGDRVRAKLVDRRSGYGRAELLEVLEPGDGRREPRCRHFGECGGCDLQHLEDERQLELKVAATIETLVRLGKIELPTPEVIAGSAWGYRMRTQLHTAIDSTGARQIGYHARGSRRVVHVEECPVLVPELERTVRRLGGLLEDSPPPRIDLALGDAGVLDSAPVRAGLPRGALEMKVGEFTYSFDAGCFFQGHRELTARLAEWTVGEDRGGLAVDLFAGVGLFSLPLATRYERVIAVEGQPSACRYARKNARRNARSNVEIVHQAVESWVDRLPEACDRVVVDPPRAGLSKEVVARLLEVGAERLTYVSCHPATLARDLKGLDSSYRVSELALVDLFPQTGHIEVIAQLALRNPST